MCKCVEYFCFFLNTPCFEILLLILFWGIMLSFSFLLFSLIGAHFFYASWEYTFFNDPSLLLQDHRKRNLFELWSIYFWWMDGMFCVTPGVGVSMYMWVYVISIMGAWKDSSKGHNNLAKLNGSQASMCRRFEHWYQHKALVGNMTIEELCFVLFWKRNHPRFLPYFEIE
jgi:hypothetical protein